jgi:DMSO/TMAO reductase YedYZ molybdopterin-dependent catalytic subunit
MPSRRDFLSYFSRLFLYIAAITSLGLTNVNIALAKIKKKILLKNTDPKSLLNEKPELLDTRNLKIMPLESFNTMGDTDIPFKQDSWRLEITGLVKSSIKMRYDELLAMPSIERNVLMVCPGFFSNHGRWKGISFPELMKKAGASKNVARVIIYGRGSYEDQQDQFELEELKTEKVFLAYAVNGKMLPIRHGLPLRVVAEGHLGSSWSKYVYKVEFI